MKKLLLLLFISFTFIGSAHANSIDGAFGYKLGQVVEDVEDFPNFHLRKEIVPKKPLPGNFSYALYTTLKDKKVYKISANDNKSILSVNDCTTSYKYKFGPYYKIMKLYEFRYGKFVKTVSKEGDWGRSVSKTYIPRIAWTSYNNSYTDGHREILIRCRISNLLLVYANIHCYSKSSPLRIFHNQVKMKFDATQVCFYYASIQTKL